MKDALERRLAELRRELAAGQDQLDRLEQRKADLRDTLLRITGAIQVLEELLASGKTRDAEEQVS